MLLLYIVLSQITLMQHLIKYKHAFHLQEYLTHIIDDVDS